MVAPTTGLGFAYYVTDGLSLRPWVSLGYSDYSGVYANVGAQLRWEIAADSRWSPYVSASALYSHNGAVSMATTSPTGTTGRPDTGSVPAAPCRATPASSAAALACATGCRAAWPSSEKVG
jgi:hypothetical protein